MIKEIGNHDTLYQSLISTALEAQIKDREFTLADFALDAKMPESSARRCLRAKLAEGTLNSRMAIKDGHNVRAYEVPHYDKF